ncbi:MAG: histidinol dehydrogenase [Alphaproteobacteria bacterium]|nr:histidinol dehydrogenase [Alphaproteobacteria bacterium]
MPRRLDARKPGFDVAFEALVGARRERSGEVDEVVAGILAEVRARGDAAVLDYTRRFDRLELRPDTLRVADAEIAAAAAQVPAPLSQALALAARRIEDFHARQVPADERYTDAEGIELGQRWTALGAVGVYVPGGIAAYPSSVLMTVIPARVAGVERIVMTVPAPDGELAPVVLAAARLAGVHEVYRIGGAQAVAALAFGTQSIAPVDKIVGPGNRYVAAAKRQVFGIVGIDMIAGPSEILVVADGANEAAWIAADLLSQAEHDEAAQAVLISDDEAFVEAVVRAAEGHLEGLARAAIARASWEAYGAVIVVERLIDAAPLIDRLAPEHLELAIAEPEALMARVRNAGAIFLGRHTPEALGDYVAGPNHVLPTMGSARFASGLSVLDFMKRTSLVRCDARGLKAIGPAAVTLAEAEGLGAHALSVALRLAAPPDD